MLAPVVKSLIQLNIAVVLLVGTTLFAKLISMPVQSITFLENLQNLMESVMNGALQNDFKIRHTTPKDHKLIIAILKDWWGGRDLTWMLPKLFLVHFCNTSFVIEKNGKLVAFLIGFLSPSNPKEGYIHFVGVHPDFRGIGIGKSLYDLFFGICKENGRNVIKACTSPVNKGSIEFHKKIGFSISKGNAKIDGTQVTLDYNKPGDSKVRFEIKI